MTRRLLLPLLLALAFVSCASTDDPATQTPKSRYLGDVGEFPVGAIPDIVLHDDARNRDVVMSIDYPISSGSYPLIILSPAYGATNRHYVGLGAHWASQGYIVARLAHSGERLATDENGSEVLPKLTAADWRERVRDVTFVLDSTSRLVRQYPELAGKIDTTKIGVAGHSYGAFIAMLLGGVKTFPGATSYADPRVKAIFAMSPQGPSDSVGLTKESFASLNVPALFMIGTQDAGTSDTQPTEWRRQAFELAPAGDKWLAVIEGATHRTFAGVRDQLAGAPDPTFQPTMTGTRDPYGRQTTDPRRPNRESAAGMYEHNRFAAVRSISLAFWDAYLRGDSKGREALEKSESRVREFVKK